MLNFTVAKTPVQYTCVGDHRYQESEKYFVTYRTDTKEELGVVQARYNIIQNQVLFDIAECIVPGILIPGTGNLLPGAEMGIWGAKCWLQVPLPLGFRLTAGESYDYRLLLINGFDGNTTLGSGVIPFRLSCANQFHRVGQYMFKSKHSRCVAPAELVKIMVNNIKENLSMLADFEVNIREIYNAVPGTRDQVKEYWEAVLRFDSESKRGAIKLDTLVKLLYSAPGSSGDWSWYNAYQTVTYYITHVGGRDGSRVRRNIFGAGSRELTRAMTEVLERISDKTQRATTNSRLQETS